MQSDQKKIFTVGQVNEYVKYLIDASPVLDSLYVRGELSNVTAYHTSGHIYFSLKDAAGVLRAVMFRSSAAKLKFRPENGMRVLVHGRVSAYVRDGQYQLYADSMEPDGVGALALAYEQLKEKLTAEGLFDPARKKPLPPYPETIGVITSPTGAAVRDIINVLGRRSPSSKMVLFPALVQGESAPKQLCAGIRFFNTRRPVDVIIIGRGGGSLEELWAFNDETLARTVAASKIPVISAVGHETDFTICDFAASVRAPTPSAAAELAVPDQADLRHRLHALSDAMQNSMLTQIGQRRQVLSTLASRRVMQSPDSFLHDRRLSLDNCTLRISHAAERRIAAAQAELSAQEKRLSRAADNVLTAAQMRHQSLCAKLAALNPLAVLNRGYSAVFTEDGMTVSSVKKLSPGSLIRLRFADGTADASVMQTSASDAPGEKKG